MKPFSESASCLDQLLRGSSPAFACYREQELSLLSNCSFSNHSAIGYLLYGRSMPEARTSTDPALHLFLISLPWSYYEFTERDHTMRHRNRILPKISFSTRITPFLKFYPFPKEKKTAEVPGSLQVTISKKNPQSPYGTCQRATIHQSAPKLDLPPSKLLSPIRQLDFSPSTEIITFSSLASIPKANLRAIGAPHAVVIVCENAHVPAAGRDIRHAGLRAGDAVEAIVEGGFAVHVWN